MTADGFEKHFGIQSMLKVHWSILQWLQWLQIDYREKTDIKKQLTVPKLCVRAVFTCIGMHTAHFQSCCLKTAPCCFYTQLPVMLMRTIRLKWKIRVDARKNELTNTPKIKNIGSRLSDTIRYSSSNISNAMMKQFLDFWEKAHLFLMQVKVCIHS